MTNPEINEAVARKLFKDHQDPDSLTIPNYCHSIGEKKALKPGELIEIFEAKPIGICNCSARGSFFCTCKSSWVS